MLAGFLHVLAGFLQVFAGFGRFLAGFLHVFGRFWMSQAAFSTGGLSRIYPGSIRIAVLFATRAQVFLVYMALFKNS